MRSALKSGYLAAAMLFATACASSEAAAQGGCEKIQNPFQYNECLAKQAPGRAARSSRSGGGDPETSGRRGGGGGQRFDAPPDPFAGSGISVNRSSGRRVQAVIDPWQGARSPAPTRRKRR